MNVFQIIWMSRRNISNSTSSCVPSHTVNSVLLCNCIRRKHMVMFADQKALQGDVLLYQPLDVPSNQITITHYTINKLARQARDIWIWPRLYPPEWAKGGKRGIHHDGLREGCRRVAELLSVVKRNIHKVSLGNAVTNLEMVEGWDEMSSGSEASVFKGDFMGKF